MTGPALDPTFTTLPYRALGDAALTRARELGVSHADFRFERVRYQHLGVRDGVLQGASDTEDLGFAVRVIHRGAWGFASGVLLTPEDAARVAESAVEVALVAAEMTTRPVEIAPEPVYDDVTWISSYDLNPLEVPTSEKAALLIDWTNRLRAHDAVEHATANLQQVQENKYYADLAGTRTTQQRVRLQPQLRGDGLRRGHRRLRLDGLDRAAGRPRLGVPHRTATTGTPSSPRSRSCSPRSSGRPPSRPAPTTW